MISSWELVALAFLALLIFGPERLPQMAKTFGRTVSKLRREANVTLDEIKRATSYEELRDSADVRELRDLAGDLKQEADGIRAEADGIRAEADSLSRAVEKPTTGVAEQAAADQPAPFDPDAT